MTTLGRVLIRDTWTDTNGNAWSTQWVDSPSGGTVDVQSNTGRIVIPVTAAYGANSWATSFWTIPAPDFELRVDLTFSTVTIENYPLVWFSDSISVTSTPNNGYGFGPYDTTANQVRLIRVDGGTQTSLNTAAVTFTVAQWSIRVRRQGGFFAGKMWLASAAEPADWTVTAWDRTYCYQPWTLELLNGGGNTGNATDIRWDNLEVRELVAGHRRRSGAR